jgi:hypothetical protein
MDRRLASLILFASLLAPQAAIASEGGGEKKKKSGGTSYISLDALSATVIRPDGRRGVLMVETGLDIPDQALRDKAEKLIPRLRAAYFQTVQVYAAGLTPGLPPNVDYISRELQRQTDLALGKPGARLLLGSVMVN